MKIENLQEGMVIKNYKELCDLLEEKVKTGEAKQNQLAYWKEYFSYHKEGNKFIINKVFNKEVKDRVDKRGGNNTVNYIDCIEKLILDLLVQDKNKGQVFLSRNSLLRELKMINENYAYCKERIPKLSKFMNVNELDIEEFYESVGNTLKRNLETALDSLKSQSLIFWMPVKTVCVAEAYVDTNSLQDNKVDEFFKGVDQYDEKIYEYNVNYQVVKKYRKATKEEIQLIIHAEREVLAEIKCDNKQEVVRFGKWDIFKEKVKEILLEEANILFYYDSYEVICNEDHIYEKWEELYDLMLEDKEKAKQQMELNQSIMERLQTNIERRNTKAKEKKDKWIGKCPDERVNRRSKENYIDDNDKLIQILINKNAKKIKDDVRKTKLK